MIRQKTVFIIGAGASKPYNYPTGPELRRQIISDYGALKNLLPSDWRQAADEFITAFRKSSNLSIDLFLSRNSEFINIGKPAIVKAIIDAENSSWFREEMRNHENMHSQREDWYSFIYQEMTKEMPSKNDYQKLADNEVTFIIFNYDRSFEYFLAESFINSFKGIEEEKLHGVLRKIKIIHVYGKIAPLPWEDLDKAIGYKQITHQRVRELSNNIHVIGEERQSIDTSLKQAQIGEAEKIFFLGFGFAQENLKILNLPDGLGAGQLIFGSGIGLLPEEIISLRLNFTGGIRWLPIPPMIAINSTRPKPENIFIESGVSCVDILRKYLFLKDTNYLVHRCQQFNGYHS